MKDRLYIGTREDSTNSILPQDHDTMATNKEGSTSKSKLIYLLFYAIGTISFVSHNFYVTANDYWMYKFRDLNSSSNSSDVKTDLQKNFTAYYSTASTVSMVAAVIVTILMARRIGIQKRLVGGIITMLSLFLITLLFIWSDTDSWQYGFFILSLAIGGLITAASGCFMISAFQLSAKFPMVYVGAQLSGQSICGILAGLTQIFALLLNVSSEVSAMIYFSICSSLILATMIFYLFVLHTNEYFQIQSEEEEEEGRPRKIEFSKVKTIARKLVALMITMILTAGSAVIIHPGVTSLVESVGKGTNRWSDVFFVPVCTFLSYNTFDFIGREVSLRWIRVNNLYVILGAGILRLGFIPLIMLCNAQPRNHLPVVFHEDYPYIIFIIIFSFTSGYFMNLCIMQVPSTVEEDEKNIATGLVVMVMIISLGACSALTNVMVNIL